MRPAHELNQIAGYGGGFIISAEGYTAEELNQMAAYAAAGGARITLKNCGHIPLHELNQIAGYGSGAIVFDFSE